MPRATKEKSKKTNKKANKNRKIDEVQKNTKDNNKFSFDDEIVIGLRKINTETINNQKKK